MFDDDNSSEGDDRENEVALPVRETKRGTKRQMSKSPSRSPPPSVKRGKGGDDDDDDDDDIPLVTPKSSNRRKRRIALDDSDEDDQPLVSSPIKRRRLVRGNSSPVKERKDEDEGENEEEDDEPEQKSPPKKAKRAGRTPRTKKEKARELLRRKRAGEIIDEDEESSSSEEDAPAKAMYDTDSDHLALNEFEDDDEGVLDHKVEKEKKNKSKKIKEKKKQRATSEGENESDESMEGFIADDSDEPLGIPDDLEIPLQFTSHSHKPLKDHFRDAIEWLVQFKINPGFAEKNHQLYGMAWKKLDDEVRGLAQSKFESSAWRIDFTKALRARPYFTNSELPKGDTFESQSCGACGRSGHPAR
jgi:hypothetical protein